MRIQRARPLQTPPSPPSRPAPDGVRQGGPQSPCPTLRLDVPTPQQGAPPGAPFVPPEWRVPHHPTLGHRGIPSTHTPLYSKEPECSPRSSPRVGQAPSPPSPQAGRGAALCRRPSEGGWARVAPTPQPACRCPVPPRRSLPLPLTQTALPRPGGARSREGPGAARGGRAAAAALAEPPPALGRRPAGPFPPLRRVLGVIVLF